MLSGNDIRKSFLDFFEQRQHTVVPSSSLVPTNDPTLMFTNSGMVQFKNNFMGLDTSLKRAVSSQRCVRAGGKHNDLENVGHTARHHTFFEMLGNFSFGDYFKEEAITWAWQWITEELKIDPARLCVTIYHDDDEAFDIWHKKIGVAKDDIIRIDTSDNFWTMGDTGPCGPCSEIFFDHGPSVTGGRPGTPEEDGDRFMEIWNLVFTQFDLQADGSKIPLKAKNIDTGAGLERVMAVAQGVHSNYDTDVFQKIIQTAAKMAGTTYGQNAENDVSLRVVADHLRAMSFLMVDGVMPSNEGRGYVLRRIMRRAMRHVHLLGVDKPFIHNLVPTLVNVMGEAYPELARGAPMVTDVVKIEEERFGKTLSRGLKVLEEKTAGLKQGDTLPGEAAFELYDTYGFPLDLTEDALKNSQIHVDHNGFDAAMAEQKQRARAAFKGSGDAKLDDVWFDLKEELVGTEFVGYETTSCEAQVMALIDDKGKRVETAETGWQGSVVVNQTPFYGESGGQVGDSGDIVSEGTHVKVSDTQKVLGGIFFQHKAEVTGGSLSVGDSVEMRVDATRREKIRNNHSATHLLNAALREVLGEHVFQKGSHVDEYRTRFDFSHPKALNAEEIDQIEARVNGMVWACGEVSARLMPKDTAIEKGAMAMFGEKYDDDVRVLTMGQEAEPLSMELCGGVHVPNTGVIGLFKITQESSVAAGVRRIEAVTGEAAWQALKNSEKQLQSAASAIKTTPAELNERLNALQKEKKKLEQELKQAKKGGNAGGIDAGKLIDSAETVSGVRFIGAVVDNMEPATLREMVDDLKNRLGSGIVLLATTSGEKSSFVAGVTKDLVEKYKAGDIVNAAAITVGGKGGGRPDMAMAGGAAGDLQAAVSAARASLNA